MSLIDQGIGKGSVVKNSGNSLFIGVIAKEGEMEEQIKKIKIQSL